MKLAIFFGLAFLSSPLAQAASYVCQSPSGESITIQRAGAAASFTLRTNDGTSFRCGVRQTRAPKTARAPRYKYWWQMPEELAKSSCEKYGGEWQPSTGNCQTY